MTDTTSIDGPEDRTLSESTFSHIIDVDIARIDIAHWLFTLADAEFQRCCPPDHIAAGQTVTDDGRRMSINVEMIGTGLVVQHYVAEVAEKHFCRMVSISDVFTPSGRTQTQVVWELSAKATADGHTEYTNHVKGTATDAFMAFIKAQGIDFEQAKSARSAASSDHNRRETPLYAESIGRAASAAPLAAEAS